MPAPPKKVQVGCAGFSGTQAVYFSRFNAVEIGSSFFNLPQVKTAERWHAQAPPGFVFTMKAWQVITHRSTSPSYRKTRLETGDREHCGFFGFNPTIRWAWDRTAAVAQALGARVVVFQSPAGFRPTKENLGRIRSFFERCKRGRLVLAWEPRGSAWDPGQVEQLGQELDLVPVVDPFAVEEPVGGRRRLRYYRLAGIGNRHHRYSETELDRLAAWCRAAGAREPICIFGNLGMGIDGERFRRKITP